MLRRIRAKDGNGFQATEGNVYVRDLPPVCLLSSPLSWISLSFNIYIKWL